MLINFSVDLPLTDKIFCVFLVNVVAKNTGIVMILCKWITSRKRGKSVTANEN
jgi:hypothetical protein